ncbi:MULTISPECIES: phage portal protein [Butyricimonas]|uniref:phage portal protein n=1 Tax=Butyricimonas TaxID=574697 RepID=UPI0007FB4903|nr:MULTISPECIES: phage portal protein [Butyricimonas]
MKLPWFNKKSARNIIARDENRNVIVIPNKDLDSYLGVFSPATITNNVVTLFRKIPEVAFPITAITNRITNGRFQLKDVKTDTIIYDNDSINKFLSQPNPLQTFGEFIQQIETYKLVTGRAFVYSNTGDFINPKTRWKMTDEYVVLPSQDVQIVYNQRVKLLSAQNITDIIDKFRFSGGNSQVDISPSNVLYIKDISIGGGCEHIEGMSRLERLKYPLSNLIAVYEARNAIYIKRGAIGAIVSNSKDDSGSVPLSPKEKEQLLKDYNDTYGVYGNKNPTMVTGIPVNFVRFNMSIQELQPFEETLLDAIAIAGEYNVPAVLIPRKDQATFSNQGSAEKSLYENVVIPEANNLCSALNSFLGLENDGMYLSVSFDHVPVLQPNAKEEAEVNKTISETCKANFLSGIITLNEWIAQIGSDKVTNPMYDKKIFDMSDEELAKIERFIR